MKCSKCHNEVVTSPFCSSITDWLNSSDHLFYPLTCLSLLFSTSLAPSIVGTAVNIFWSVSENFLAIQRTSIVISTAPSYCWPTLFSQLRGAFKNTWFLKSSFTKQKVVGEVIKEPMQLAPIIISISKSLWEDPQYCGSLQWTWKSKGHFQLEKKRKRGSDLSKKPYLFLQSNRKNYQSLAKFHGRL